MANICRSLRTKNFFSPVLKSLTHIGFIGVKKNWSKISHLGTFNLESGNTHFSYLSSIMFTTEIYSACFYRARVPLCIFRHFCTDFLRFHVKIRVRPEGQPGTNQRVTFQLAIFSVFCSR
jgi:hypothetical protein